MTRLLNIIILVLALVLSPPAALAVVSNNAVPGDSTYPIKRGLEDIIYTAASLNPVSQAWFAKARSDRRFQEITILITQGKDAKKTLNELVEQTQVTANQISQISDPIQREKLISQLSDSITKYDAGLAQISQIGQPIASTLPQPSSNNPQASTIPAPSVVTQPTNITGLTPLPIISSLNSPLPIATPAPVSPAPNQHQTEKNEQIGKARDELNKIKKKLEEEKPSQNRRENQSNQGERNQQRQGGTQNQRR